MKRTNPALKVALAAVEQLPPKLQRQLAEQVLTSTTSQEDLLVVYLHRLPASKQTRLKELMDKNNEGQLTVAEQSELKRLGERVDELVLANSKALARVLRPELFDERGQPVKRRLRLALKATSVRHNGAKRRAGGR